LYRKAFLLAGLNELKNIFGAGSEGSQFVESVYHDEIESLFKGPGSDLEKMLAYDLKYELANNQLLRVDRLSMAFSLEARVPFLGRDFSEFALSLPASCKIKRARQKFLLRESFRGILPGEILNRPKTGRKGSQGITGLFFEKALNSAFERLLKSRKDFLSEFFDVDYLSDFFKGKVFTDPVFGLKIRQKSAFLLLSFFIFHFLYIDNDFRKSSDIPFLKEIL
jgi:asparagine synthetase B (glutamine-hydrolysing)